jgi:hypothetical protein
VSSSLIVMAPLREDVLNNLSQGASRPCYHHHSTYLLIHLFIYPFIFILLFYPLSLPIMCYEKQYLTSKQDVIIDYAELGDKNGNSDKGW